MYNVIDPVKVVPLFSINDFKKLLSNEESQNIQLTLYELKNVLSIVSLKQLYFDTINENWKEEKERKEALDLIIALSFQDNTLENYTKEYLYKIMDDYGFSQRLILNDLTKEVNRGDVLFKNKEFLDYSSTYLTDEVTLLRIADFGKFLSHKISDDIFRKFNSELKSKFSNTKIEISKLTQKVVESTEHINYQFKQATIKLMINAFHYTYNPNYSNLRALDFAKNYLLDPRIYSKEKEVLLVLVHGAMQYIIKEDRNRNYNKGWNR